MELRVVLAVVVVETNQHLVVQELLDKDLRVDQEQIPVEIRIMNKVVVVVALVKLVTLTVLAMVATVQICHRTLELHMENQVGSQVVEEEVLVPQVILIPTPADREVGAIVAEAITLEQPLQVMEQLIRAEVAEVVHTQELVVLVSYSSVT
jgi:hypothetical protein